MLIPTWMLILANAYVPVNALGMLKTILMAIVILSRYFLWLGFFGFLPE